MRASSTKNRLQSNPCLQTIEELPSTFKHQLRQEMEVHPLATNVLCVGIMVNIALRSKQLMQSPTKMV